MDGEAALVVSGGGSSTNWFTRLYVEYGHEVAGAVRSAGARGIAYAAGFAASVIIARALGPAGRGEYAAAVTTAGLVALVGSLGIGQVLARAKSRLDSRDLLGAAAPMAAGSGAAIAAIAAIGSLVAAPDPLLLVALIAVPASTVGLVAMESLVILGHVGRRDRVVVVVALAQTGVLVVAGLAGALTPMFVVMVWAGSELLMAGQGVSGLFKQGVGPVWRPTAARRLTRMGLRLYPSLVAKYAFLRADLLLVTLIAGPSSAGLYAVALTMAEIHTAGAIALYDRSVSQVVEVAGRGGDLKPFARRSLLASMVAAVPVAVIIVLIPLIFGEEFSEARWPAAVLLSASCVFTSGRPYDLGIVVRARARSVNGVALGALGVNAAVNLALIGPLGPLGAAVASAVGYSVYVLLARAAYRRSCS